MMQPTLSKKNTILINNLIKDNNINCIVEYGSGNSTLYYLNNIINRPLTFVSIENDKKWFYHLINRLKNNCSTHDLSIHKWSHKQHINFFNKSPLLPYTSISDGFSKSDSWKNRFFFGPFFKFSKIKTLAQIFKFINLHFRLYSHLEDGTFLADYSNIKFVYKLVPPAIKDQFRESANADNYVNAGLNSIPNDVENVMILIDAGPRHYIFDKAIAQLDKKNLIVCLFDAHRPEYIEIINKYNGNFFRGENQLLDGTDFYSQKYPNLDELELRLSKELYIYKNFK
jgi:hypothetical protein